MWSPDELASRPASGLLSFPVTHFDSALRFDEPSYREYLAWQVSFEVAGLFAADGTGQGFSLSRIGRLIYDGYPTGVAERPTDLLPAELTDMAALTAA
jgi:hypothetical protein